MAVTYTPNYNLGKQEEHNDKFDMSVITADMDKIDTALSGKLDKTEGKSLISDSEIERLAGIENYDDTAIKAEISAIESAYQLKVPRTLKFVAYNESAESAVKYFKLFTCAYTASNTDITFKTTVIGSYSATGKIPYREYIARGRKQGTAFPTAVIEEIYTSKTIQESDSEIVFTYDNDTKAINCYLKIRNRYQTAEALVEICSGSLFTRLEQLTVYSEPNAIITQYIEEIPDTETVFTTI